MVGGLGLVSKRKQGKGKKRKSGEEQSVIANGGRRCFNDFDQRSGPTDGQCTQGDQSEGLRGGLAGGWVRLRHIRVLSER